MTESRTKNSFRNYGATVVAQMFSILLNFIGRTFFIKLLSIEYLGVNGLFSNILSLLSLAELGVGTAITYMMYKPIAENDIQKVAAYNNLFRQIYNCVGIFVLIVGLSFTPFIDELIKEPPNISENLYIVYVLFVLNSAISYFFTYKRSLLIAYQKEYINSQNVLQFAIIKDIVLIGLLFLFRNFYIYLAAQILITFASNVAISYKTNKLFPQIVNITPGRVSKIEIRTIVKNTAAMVCHKIGSVVVSGTGNMFISYYVGITTVGIYSNYVLITLCANQIIGKGVNSLTASFGNLVATSGHNEVYRVFKNIYFLNFIIAFSAAVLFYSLVEPFITLWIGADYILDFQSLLIIVTNAIFFYQLRIPSQMVINTYGLFWQIKWKSLYEAAVNLCCSFFFAAYLNWGIRGILLAGLVSNITTSLWWEPYVAFKYGMKFPLVDYVKNFLSNVVFFVATLILLHIVFGWLDSLATNLLLQMVIRAFVSVSVILLIVCLVYGRTSEFKYAVGLVNRLFNRQIK